MLYEMGVFLATLNMHGNAWNPPFSKETMVKLVNEIYNQQSNKLIEVNDGINN
jgi:hypothetical protein